MEGPPLKLVVEAEAEPVAFHTPVPIPIHWQDEVKAGLDRDVNLEVIEPVTWCHQMVTWAKKNGKLRRTVDFQPLNAHATRETQYTQSPFHQVRAVPQGMKKTVSDGWNGYHSVLLRKEREYTIFITPWGRYRYCTTPQGYIASGDGYSRWFNEIVSDIPNRIKVIDDALLWTLWKTVSFRLDILWKEWNQSWQIFSRCWYHWICRLREHADSVWPCKRYLEAITDFPAPNNITDMCSWFGLINQV